MCELRKTCTDCRLAFGLVERHPDFNTICTGCAAELEEPLAQCDGCGVVLQRGEFVWGDWGQQCGECAPDRIRSDVSFWKTWFDKVDPEFLRDETLNQIAWRLLTVLNTKPLHHRQALRYRNDLLDALELARRVEFEERQAEEQQALEVS